MLYKNGLGDHGSDATRSCKSNEGADQMNEKDEDVAHAASYQNRKTVRISVRFSNSPWTRKLAVVFRGKDHEAGLWSAVGCGTRRLPPSAY